ncbi:ORF1 [torque teno Delphinidae virus 56]
MPAYPYRRRRWFRRRGAGLRAGPYRRRRYYGRPYRRRRWYRRFRRAPYRVRRRRRIWARKRKWRRRYRKWRRRVGPFNVKQFAPPIQTNCYITGTMPLMLFDKGRMHLPYKDPLTDVIYGGSLSCTYWTLDMLYEELKAGRATWSRSNMGFPYAKFLWAKFKLYRHDYFSYFFKWDTGKNCEKNVQWSDLHPATLMRERRRCLIKCNQVMNKNRRFSTKKLRIRQPVETLLKWYTQCELSQTTLIRTCTSLCNLQDPWFYAPYCTTDDCTFDGFYWTVGYQTPDIRTFRQVSTITSATQIELSTFINFTTCTEPDGSNKFPLWDQNTLGNIAKAYQHWGGLLNTFIGYHQHVTFCGDLKDTIWWLPQYASVAHIPRNSSTLQYTTWNVGTDKFKEQFCDTGTVYGILYKQGTAFSKTDGGVSRKTMLRCQVSGGSAAVGHTNQNARCYESVRRLNLHDLNIPKDSQLCQGFWVGRYSWYYDTGYGNKVWGIYMPAVNVSTANKQAYMYNFVYNGTGPPPCADGAFKVVLLFENIPYYKLFYGHTYVTFLKYCNGLYPRVLDLSFDRKGFVAIGITCWPGEDVKSGIFWNGSCPLPYLGYNHMYFSQRYNEVEHGTPWTKFWPWGQSYPPLKHNGTIDWDCKVFTILRDGRSVLVGSTLEPSLLDNMFRKVLNKTHDDILAIGRSGPYMYQEFHNQTGIVNLTVNYRFKFKWGADRHPGRWTSVKDPSSFCDEESCPLPPGFPNADEFIPPGSPSKEKRKQPGRQPERAPRMRRSALHPEEVSASYTDPEVDLTDGGMYTTSAFKRLTTSSLDTLAGHSAPRRPRGTTEENALWNAFRGRVVDSEPSCCSSSGSTASESSQESSDPYPILHSILKSSKVKKRYRRDSSSPGAVSDETYSQPARRRRKALPDTHASPPRVSTVGLRHLLRHRRQLEQLRRLTRKLCLKRSGSCTDLTDLDVV